METALLSPTYWNRSVAVGVLKDWPREQWPAQARATLQRAEQAEPDLQVKNRIARLLASEDAGPRPSKPG